MSVASDTLGTSKLLCQAVFKARMRPSPCGHPYGQLPGSYGKGLDPVYSFRGVFSFYSASLIRLKSLARLPPVRAGSS